MLSIPLNIPKWQVKGKNNSSRWRILINIRLEENSHLLQPPINNYCVYNEDVTVMIVGGPNSRTDYHINETPEWFYQLKGAMLLKVVDDGEFKDIIIEEGCMFLLPANVPHNPVRFANTVGIVLEQKRSEGSLDRLRWYCENCKNIVNEESFHCTDLGSQIKAAVTRFQESEELRICPHCNVMASIVAGSVSNSNSA